MKIRLIILCCFALLGCDDDKKNEFNILNFGAQPNTNKVDTVPIQMAIDMAHKNGGGRVIIPNGVFISGTIILKSNVELFLSKGAQLVGSIEHDDYPQQTKTKYRSLLDKGGWYALIFALEASNIAISGSGTIDGQGPLQKGRPNTNGGDLDGRPRNILFKSCKYISVTGITLKNSGMWNQHYLNSEDISIDNIKVYNHGNRNNDGIDIDGCRRVKLTNSTFDSSDDAVVLKSTGTAACEDIVI